MRHWNAILIGLDWLRVSAHKARTPNRQDETTIASDLKRGRTMLMFFFSSEHAEVEQVRKELIEAGIPCEVRDVVPGDGLGQRHPEEELWIQNENDSHRALVLCVTRGLGFAKRSLPPDWFAERPQDNADDKSAEGEARARERAPHEMNGAHRDAA
jgi:hypothetical protein